MNEEPIPAWDKADPAGSFKAFANAIHTQAREAFLQDKTHAEILFLMPLDGQGQLVQVTDQDRDKLADSLRQYVTEHYTFGVLHIAEGWIRLKEGKNDHIFRQIEAGEMKVSDLKEEHRKEALSVTAQSRDGYSVLWVDEIVRDGSSISLKPAIVFHDVEGRFGKLFG